LAVVTHDRYLVGIDAGFGGEVINDTAGTPCPCADGLPFIRCFRPCTITLEQGYDTVILEARFIRKDIVIAHSRYCISAVYDIIVRPSTGLAATLPIGMPRLFDQRKVF